jgi:hypothetical protein
MVRLGLHQIAVVALEELIEFGADERRWLREYFPSHNGPGGVVDRIERNQPRQPCANAQVIHGLVTLQTVLVDRIGLIRVNARRWVDVEQLVEDLPNAQLPQISTLPHDTEDRIEQRLFRIGDALAPLGGTERNRVRVHGGLLRPILHQSAVSLFGIGRDHFLTQRLVQGLHPLAIAFSQHREEPGIVAIEVRDAARNRVKPRGRGGSVASVPADDESVTSHDQRIDNSSTFADACDEG